MRPASQRFFKHSCMYLRILTISNLATFLGTNSLSVLMWRKAVNQSINYPLCTQSSPCRSLCLDDGCCTLRTLFPWNRTVKSKTQYLSVNLSVNYFMLTRKVELHYNPSVLVHILLRQELSNCCCFSLSVNELLTT